MSTTLGDLIVELHLDPKAFLGELESAKTRAMATAKTLEKEIKLSPKVDVRELHALNDLLDVKQRHLKQTQQFFNQNALKPKIDFSDLDKLERKLNTIARGGSVNVRVGVAYGAVPSSQNPQTQARNDGSRVVTSEMSRQTQVLKKELSGVTKAIIDSRKGPLGSILSGAGQQVGMNITSALQSSLKRNFGFDTRKAVGRAADAAAVPVKVLITENAELQKVLDKTGKIFETRIRQAGYKVGDGIVAALDDKGAGAQSKINAFISNTFDATQAKKEFAAIKKEAAETAKEVGKAFVRAPNLRPYTEKFGKNLAASREIALKERAVPLVQQRAQEILNQNRSKNSAKLVNDKTEQFIVSTGGYAGARGLSGQRIAADLGKQFGENVVSVWVKNLDTDIPKESMGKASDKLGALLTSLAKPNLRGYSNDAVEMAAQVVAALERNPDLKVKLLGESGGGFAAEEAAKILQMMGAGDRVEYMGVGTPNLMGGLNAPGKKIISPDEYLGAETAGFYARYGLADVSSSDQQILGVKGHPYENYKEAAPAEFQNFLYGAPDAMGRDELSQVKAVAKTFKSMDTSSMSSRELESLSKAAYQNLQLMRRQLLVATEDTKDELQEIADAFEQAYVKTVSEPKEFDQVRAAIKQAQGLYAQILEKPGIEAGLIAKQLVVELKQYQSEFSSKFSGSVGTLGKKFAGVDAELSELIKGLDDPSLGVKKRTPIAIPVQIAEEPKEIVLADQSGVRGDATPIRQAGLAAEGFVQKAGAGLAKAAVAAGGMFGSAAEKMLVKRINNLLMDVPGMPGVIEGNASQISKLSDLTSDDINKLSQLGTEDIIQALTQLGVISKKVVDTVAPVIGGAAQIALPAAGKGMLALGGAAVGGARAALEGAPEQAALLQGRVQMLREGVNKTQALLGARPEQSAQMAEFLERGLPRLAAEIDEAIAQLPSADRTKPGEGAQLANLKSQIAKLEGKFEDITKEMKTLSQMAGNESNQVDVIDIEIISELDQIVEATKQGRDKAIGAAKQTQIALENVAQNAQMTGRESLALPAGKTQINATGQIKAIGQQFSEQTRSARALGAGSNEGASIAQEVLNAAAEAKQVIDDLIKGLGEQATPAIKKAASTAKGQITKAETGASKIKNQSQALGVEISAGLNQGLTASIGDVKQSAEILAQAAIDGAKDTLEIRSPSRVFQRIGQFAVEGFEKGLSAINGVTFDELKTKVMDFAKGLSVLGVAALIAPRLLDFANASTQAAISLENLATKFDFNFAGEGAAKLKAVTDSATALRQDIDLSRQSYLAFATAVKGTPLEFSTDLGQTAIQQAALTQGMTPEELQRSQTALIQSAGKGQIYSEEIFGQLAESMPNAPGVFARALGTDIAGFRGRTAAGLSSEEALPKFFAQLQAESSVGVPDALSTTQASMTNLNNQMKLLQETAGKPLLPIKKMGLDVSAAAIGLLVDKMGLLIQLIGAAALAALAKFTASMLASASAGNIFAASYGLGTNALKGFLALLKSPATSMAGLTVGIMGAIELLKIFGKAFSDAGGEARDFADSAAKSMENYKKALEGVKQDDTGESLLGSTIIGDLIGKENATNLERTGQQALANSPLGKYLEYASLGRIQTGRTFGQKQAEDQQIAMNDAIAATDEVLSMMYQKLQEAQSGGGALGRLAEINTQTRDIQTQRRMLNRGDSAGRARLDEQERALMTERAPLDLEVRGLTAQNAANIEQLKRFRDEAEKIGDMDAYKRYNDALKAAEKAQEDFNTVLEKSASTVAMLATQFARIQGKLDEANSAISLFAEEAKQGIASDVLTKGLTQGQEEYERFAQSQGELTQRIKANNEAIRASFDVLRDPETSRILEAGGFSFDSSPADIRAKAEGMGESTDKDRLNQAADQLDNIKRLQVETAGIETQIVEARVASQRALEQSARDIADFFRSIQRNVEEMARTARESDFETAVMRERTRLQQSLSSFSSRFFGEAIDLITGLFDSLFEPMRKAFAADSQIAQLTAQLEDTVLQASGIQRNAYGAGGSVETGATTPFRDIRVTSAVDASGEPGLDYVVGGGRGAQFGAVAPGEVIKTVTDQNWENNMGRGGPNTGRRGYGNQVVIRTVDEVTGQFVDMLYAHLDTVAVQVGQQVGIGTVLGTQGRTGSTTGPHVSLDFFAPDSRQTNAAALAMRDRTARELANGAPNLNAQIAQPAPQAPARPQAPSSQQYRPRGGTLSQAERVQSDPSGAAAMAATAARLGLDPTEFAALMSWESGGSFNPNVRGGDGNQYQGLIQFSPSNQRQYGIQSNQSIAEQMPAIERYLLDRGFQPGQHDIRHAYSAVLTGQADERYWDRRDSNGTTVRNAAPKFQSGDHYERAQQFLRDSGVAGAGSVAGGAASAMTTPTMPGADTSQLGEGIAMAQSAAAQQTASIRSRLAAELESLNVTFDRDLERSSRALRDGTEELDRTATASERELQDIQLQSLGDSASANLIRQLTESTRALTDSNTQQARDLRDATENVAELEDVRATLMESLERARDLGVSPDQIAKLENFLPEIDTAIASGEADIARLQAVLDSAGAVFAERDRMAVEQAARERELQRQQTQRRTQELQFQRQMGGVTNSSVQSIMQSGFDRQGIGQNYQAEIAEAQLEMQAFMEGLSSGAIFGDEAIAEAETQIKFLKERLISLQDQRSIELEINSDGALRALEQFQREMGATIGDLSASAMERGGDIFGANRVRRTMGAAEVAQQTSRDMESIDALEGTGLKTPMEIEAMREQVLALNDLKLDGLRDQFKTLGDTIKDNVKGAFQGFFTDVLSGTASIEDAFKNLLQNLLSQLAELAVNSLFTDLFGGGGSALGGLKANAKASKTSGFASVFDGGGESSGGGGFLGTALGLAGSLFGFADGVDARTLPQKDQSGFMAIPEIAEAMKRERSASGSQPILSVINRDEIILNKRQAERFRAMNLGEVLNFNQGYNNKPSMAMPSMSANSTTVNVPVTVNSSGNGEKPSIDINALQDGIRGVVYSVIEKETKPMGRLNQNRR